MLTLALHPFQEQDVDRMVVRGSLLLGYGMGTGKTIMALAACEALFGSDQAATALLVVPASLRWQWANRIAMCTDTGRRGVSLRRGAAELVVPAEDHCVLLDADTDYAHVKAARPDYMICSYETLTRNTEEILALDPDIVVIDEAQMIKHPGSARTKAVKKLRPRYRYALTGTPMDNGRPEEIYSIMQWVDPSVLGRWDLFDKAYISRNRFGGVAFYKHLDTLHTTLRNAMARKIATDPDVAAHMPKVEYVAHRVILDEDTQRLYARVTSDLAALLEECGASAMDVEALYSADGGASGGDSALGRAMSARTVTRMLLDHPELVRISARNYGRKERATDPGSAYAHTLMHAGLLYAKLGTPKLDELQELLAELLVDPAAKGVVFSSYATMLPLLADALKRYGPTRFDGGMNANMRERSTAAFATDPECRLLLATDAGGAGLDLPTASFVINYDLPAGLGRYSQRNARHQRAGSPHPVIQVIDLVCADTLDEHDHAVLRSSAAVARAGVDGEHGGAPGFAARRPSLQAHLA